MSENALGRARAGDEDAFRELIAPYRAELQLHCYRILGSLQDAEDAVQETLLAAWRGLRAFEERAVGAFQIRERRSIDWASEFEDSLQIAALSIHRSTSASGRASPR